jgi:hypothetical protein
MRLSRSGTNLAERPVEIADGPHQGNGKNRTPKGHHLDEQDPDHLD